MRVSKFQNVIQHMRYSKLYRAPKWIINKILISGKDKGVDQTVDMRLGHKITIRPTEKYLENILYSRQYHDENVFLLDKYLSEGSVIFDIGANVGLYACAYAQYFKSLNVKIYAIEAAKNNFNYLQNNINLNHFTNIEAFNLALGKEKGELEITLPSEDFIGNAVGDNIKGEKLIMAEKTPSSYVQKVEMVTLDEWVENNKIEKCDFIKIDIEGAEFFVFLGGQKFIKKARPIIQSEYNKFWWERAGVSFSDLSSFFKEINYKVAIEKGSYYEVIENVDNYEIVDGLVDLLLIPQEKI